MPVQLIKNWTKAECKNCAKEICLNPLLKRWVHSKTLSIRCYHGEAEPVAGTEKGGEDGN